MYSEGSIGDINNTQNENRSSSVMQARPIGLAVLWAYSCIKQGAYLKYLGSMINSDGKWEKGIT